MLCGLKDKERDAERERDAQREREIERETEDPEDDRRRGLG